MNARSLRLRVLLLFAGLAGGLIAVVALAEFVGRRVLIAAAEDAGASMPGLGDALALMALIACLGVAGLVTLIWYFFDTHVARPIEMLAGRILTGTPPEKGEGRYLADLAPAARAAAASQAAARADLAAALDAHAGAMAHETSILEGILSDIGAGAVLADAQGRVLFYNAAAAQLLPGLGLDHPLSRYFAGGGLAAAQDRIEAGANATDVALTGADGKRLSGRMRPLAEQEGGTVLILRPARREPVPPRAAIEELRASAAALTPLLAEVSCEMPPRIAQALSASAQRLTSALRDLETSLYPGAPRQRRVAAEELARGIGLPLGAVAPVTLAADGWQVGGLLVALGQRLAEAGRTPTAAISTDGSEALLSLSWPGPVLPMDLLEDWLKASPDSGMPSLTGEDILAAHGTTMWSEPDPENTERARLVLPLVISDAAQAARPAVTYDFAIAGHGAPDMRPLSQLTCVVFDTETTGLALSDRIVQIAGLRIAGGKLTGEQFDTLVDPGRPVPPASTEIHGITDAMVAGAPDLRTALRGFHHFSEGAVLIAHNAPFDMGLLRRAEGETGQHFPNRVMDTVLLSAMIWGQGVVHSLDAICERLGIDLPADQRHTAMGDATATAQAYLRMIPALEAKGITRFEHVLAQSRNYRRLLSDANLASAHGN
ncbi:3'-5' exonuclease [Paracoccus aurantiacus]|uniref:DNA-directed DNA polymerase n=1 Tax=Paracoccus aurantiacus TaxID=2599412 RepID=A0A5C6S869_9RHOB|nr:exonuclease domain-containing protein [Paracoccus aurantiacus]TXB70568.1 3'-5' exonuclease [Paracoccus aurantiacus]